MHPNVEKVCLVPFGAEREMARTVADLRSRYGCSLEIKGAFTPEGDARVQSRWLKITLAAVIRRDCVFIDSDTLFVRPLDFSLIPRSPIAAAINRDGIKGVQQSSETWVKEEFAQCGWSWPAEPHIGYLNTGVVAYRNDAQSLAFCEQWMRNWIHFRALTKHHYDQIPFNRTSFETRLVGEIPQSWNAPVGVLPQTAPTAAIFHYYASSGHTVGSHTLWGSLLARDRNNRLPVTRVMKRQLSARRPFVGLGATTGEYWAARQWTLYALAAIQHHARALRTAWRRSIM